MGKTTRGGLRLKGTMWCGRHMGGRRVVRTICGKIRSEVKAEARSSKGKEEECRSRANRGVR